MQQLWHNPEAQRYSFLSPEGRYVVYLVGVQLILLSIYCLSERIWDFKNKKGLSTFFPSEMIYLMGRVGRAGRVGRVGRGTFVSFNFFHFKIY